MSLLHTDEAGLVHFDARLADMATQAHLVLRVETQHTIQQITSVSDEDIASAMDELERKEKKRK